MARLIRHSVSLKVAQVTNVQVTFKDKIQIPITIKSIQVKQILSFKCTILNRFNHRIKMELFAGII